MKKIFLILSCMILLFGCEENKTYIVKEEALTVSSNARPVLVMSNDDLLVTTRSLSDTKSKYIYNLSVIDKNNQVTHLYKDTKDPKLCKYQEYVTDVNILKVLKNVVTKDFCGDKSKPELKGKLNFEYLEEHNLRTNYGLTEDNLLRKEDGLVLYAKENNSDKGFFLLDKDNQVKKIEIKFHPDYYYFDKGEVKNMKDMFKSVNGTEDMKERLRFARANDRLTMNAYFNDGFYYFYFSSIDILNNDLPLYVWKVSKDFKLINTFELKSPHINDVNFESSCLTESIYKPNKIVKRYCFNGFSINNNEEGFVLSVFGKLEGKIYYGIPQIEENYFGLYLYKNNEWSKRSDGIIAGYDFMHIPSNNKSCELFFTDIHWQLKKIDICE